MYRIAVIENETELQRYGHANVVRNLSQSISASADAKYFVFQSFTSANIMKLFSDGTDNLMEFDALFLSTNACSDRVVLETLLEKKSILEVFIADGRGLFVGYQKKLTTEITIKEKVGDKEVKKILAAEEVRGDKCWGTKKSLEGYKHFDERIFREKAYSFLPETYQIQLIEEFNFIEVENETSLKRRVKESAEGDIRIFDKNRDDVVLSYPQVVKQNDIVKRCRDNDFSNHLYKSSIYPLFDGSYEMLLYDDAPDDSSKRILLARAVPMKDERIIVSAIALDWENHTQLLCNILEYIAKGVPRLAFIDGDNFAPTNKDFNYLVNSAIIAKIPCARYTGSREISIDKQFIHDVFFFSPSVTEEEVGKFWKKLKEINKKKKIYHLLTHSGGETVLKQYSNTSSFDALKQNVASWIKSYKTVNGFWDGFWVSYDTLLMMKQCGVDCKAHIDMVYTGIKKRRQDDGSYDRLIGCTLGMLKLYFDFWSDKVDEISQTAEWIEDRIFEKQKLDIVPTKILPISVFEKESYLLIYKELEQHGLKIRNSPISLKGEKYDELINEVYTVLIKPQSNGLNCTEIELCRHLQFCVFFGKNDCIEPIIKAIFKKRDYVGRWVGVGRTAGVLVSLLNALGKNGVEKYNLEKKIEESVNYLLEEYNVAKSNWNGLVLDTARSLHAICLYNSMFSLSTKDFFDTVQLDTKIIGYNNIIETSLSTSSDLQKRLFALNERIDNITGEKKDLNNKIAEQEKQINDLIEKQKADRSKFEKQWRVSFSFALFFGIIIAGLVLFICVDLKSGEKLFTELKFGITTGVSMLLSFVIGEIVHRKLFPEKHQEKKDKQKKLKTKQKKGDK